MSKENSCWYVSSFGVPLEDSRWTSPVEEFTTRWAHRFRPFRDYLLKQNFKGSYSYYKVCILRLGRLCFGRQRKQNIHKHCRAPAELNTGRTEPMLTRKWAESGKFIAFPSPTDWDRDRFKAKSPRSFGSASDRCCRRKEHDVVDNISTAI